MKDCPHYEGLSPSRGTVPVYATFIDPERAAPALTTVARLLGVGEDKDQLNGDCPALGGI